MGTRNGRRALVLAGMLTAIGCEGASAVDAGGGDPDASIDAGDVVVCERAVDCDDGSFCTTERCAPGESGADGRGCVTDGSPCASSETCVEAEDQCLQTSCTDPDVDGDGHDAITCGGDDCDDDDNDRFPGHVERCDADGHDEDCDEESLAGPSDGDGDGDGAVSAACCNADGCGSDCADDDPSIAPGARELCDGLDQDCDAVTDEASAAAAPLCPGGTCTAGRCDLDDWSRTFGGALRDELNSIAMDDLGNVYVIGIFQGSADFGSGTGPVGATPTAEGEPGADIFVAAFEANGAFDWVRTFGGPAIEIGMDIAFDSISGRLFFTALGLGTVDFGGGARGTEGPQSYVVALERDGSYAWDRELDLGVLTTISIAASDGPVVSGVFAGSFDFGGGARTATAGEELFVLRMDREGERVWDYTSTGATASSYVYPVRVSIDAAGRVGAAGAFGGDGIDFGRGVRETVGGRDVYALLLDPTGALVWNYTAGGPTDDGATSMAIAASGEVFVIGQFEGAVDFGMGEVTGTVTESSFLVRLGSTGTLERIRIWGGGDDSSTNRPNAVALDAAGNVHVVGAFSGNVNFGGGTSVGPLDGAAFLAIYDADLNHRSDRAFSYPGAPITACPYASCQSVAADIVIGPADSTAISGVFQGVIELGAGPRLSDGDLDGFVVRLAN